MKRNLILIFVVAVLVLVGGISGFYLGSRDCFVSTISCPVCQKRDNANVDRELDDGIIAPLSELKSINGPVREFSSSRLIIDLFLPAENYGAQPIKESRTVLINDKTVFALLVIPDVYLEEENGTTLLETKTLTNPPVIKPGDRVVIETEGNVAESEFTASRVILME